MFCYLKQKSRNKCVKNHIKRCNKKHNKKTKTLQWQQYQRLYRYKDLMYKIHNIPAWQLSHKKHQQQKEYLRNLKCDKLQIELRIYKEFYKKEASHEHINVKSLNDTFNTNINTTNNNKNNNNNNNNNNKHQKYANLLSNNFIINYNKQQQQQRFITRHEQQTETDDIELQAEEAEEENEKASWEIFNHNRNTRVENSLQNIIFMLNTYQQILINFNKIDNNNTTNNKYNLKFNNNNYNYKYILKNEPKPINKITEILMSIQHNENNNNLKTGTARSTSFNNVQFNEKILVKPAKFKTKEITIPTTPPNEIVTVTGRMQETETICKEINITIIVNSNIKQHSHPTKEHHEHHEQHEQMKEEEIEEEEEEKVIKTVKNVKPSHYQQIEHYIHEYQIQKHLRRQNQQQQQQQQQQQLSEKPASANKHNTNHYNNNKNNNNIMIKNHLNNEKKSIIYTNGFRLILLALFVIYSCPCGNALRLANGGMSKSPSANKEQLNIGLIAPHTNFGKREYLRAINTAVSGLTKTRGAKLTFLENYSFQPRNIHFDMMSLTPSPTAILSTLCKEFLQVNVSAILYMMNNEQFGHSTASAQYFLQLAGYLGIPVISWNADNSGLERRASQSTLQLQLAPSIEHQSAAMLSILERYKWHQFSIVTSQIAGHDDFVQAVRERVAEMQDHFKFTILNAIVVTRSSDLMELVNSEARVMLLYATQSEAITILSAAEDMRLTGENYVWVVSQSVIEKKDAHPQFPVGMLGVHFDTSSAALMNEISNAIKIYGYGVEAYLTDPVNRGRRLTTQSVSCEDEGRGRWDNGEIFFRYLRNVSIEGDINKPNIEFTTDGDLKSAELKIMNLRPSANSKNLVWEEIGVWKSWETQKLDIRDIAWPGNSHAPPQGVPEKFHLKITFLEEAPYINLSPADPVSGKCLMDRGVLCRVAADHDMAADMDMGQAHRNETFYQCCSGFCIDLLEKFAEELGFTYELVRVEDGKWGTLQNGKWNGLIADLVNRKTDMVLTSLMINTEREAVVDFSEPFMETGIAIVVAKRTGIISPTAFLEPFDTASWMLVGIVAIQAATFMIFLFEWLSPSGYNMKLYLQNTNAKTPYRFSLFRTYWLVWAVLFQAAVHVDSPRGFTSRFMTNVWALFAVVFLAIYTANLAAFMITREEFHEFSGLNDSRLVYPYSHKPSFRYGTIPYSHTDSTINKYFRDMAFYMRQYNKSSVANGVASVLNGNLDAFIYDGTVLDYLVAQDEDCRLMIVGSWYAMTGYGLAFSRNSKYVEMFNKRLLEFRANGDLERLRRYWMTGTCRPGKQEHKSSDPLALEQFLSAFLLLMAGILLAALLLFLEHLYFKYIPKRLAKKDDGNCCSLISLSMGKSLTFRGAVHEATEVLKRHRCNDPICDTHLWKVKHELDMTSLRIRQLEKTLEQHGIKPPQLRLASSTDLLNHHHLKERPPLLGNLSLAASAQDLYRSYKTEIAEMETVL